MQHQAGSRANLGQQRLLGAAVGDQHLLLRQDDGVAQIQIVTAPCGNVGIEHLADRIGDPGACVDAVGDFADGKLREHGAGDLAVLQGHTVGVAREVQRQQGHIQHAVLKAAQLFKTRGAVGSEDADRLFR